MNDNYEAKTEDLKYYKLIFQEILFNEKLSPCYCDAGPERFKHIIRKGSK